MARCFFWYRIEPIGNLYARTWRCEVVLISADLKTDERKYDWLAEQIF